MSKRRKILFIVTDQFRADCVAGEMAKHINLPNIRALQAEAVTFTHHFSVTNPCGPARASILTGLYAMNHRSVRNGAPLDKNLTNLALEVRKSGYEPLLYGYTDTSHDPRAYHPSDPYISNEEMVMPGFHEVVEMRAQSSFPWRAHLKAKGYDLPSYEEFYHPVSSVPGQPAKLDDPTFYKAVDSDTAFLTDELLKDLSVRAEQDWFAHVTYIRPHPPLVASAPYNKMYNPDDLPLPPRMETPEAEAAVHPFLNAAIDHPSMESITRGFKGQLDPQNDDHVQTLRAIYLGLATEVDTHVGRIISFLKESGQYDDTTIVLMSDHGEMLGDHHMWGKQHVFDPAYRVPLIIRDPENSGQHGTSVHAFTESVDITPTIIDLLGGDVPGSMDGHSLRPFLEGKSPDDWRDCVLMELDFAEPNKETHWQQATGLPIREANLTILREERFKLVHFNGGLAPLLFDLEDDPNEMHNLADDPAHTATLLRLTQKLLSLRMKHTDHTLTDYKITSQGAYKRPLN